MYGGLPGKEWLSIECGGSRAKDAKLSSLILIESQSNSAPKNAVFKIK